MQDQLKKPTSLDSDEYVEGEKCKYRLLFVEDHPVLRKQLEFTLSREGLDVTTAENGLRALELFKNNFYPILITDWMMPVMHGLELCKAIRSIPTPGYVYIILLTAKSSKEDIVTGLDAGADDYLCKPFNPDELIARIRVGIRILNLEGSLNKANEEIRILSVTDPLTQCYNRSYLNEQLPNEIRRARRYGRPLSIALSDIDHFKQINDAYGHQAGDLLLIEFVKHLHHSIRSGIDWIVRYGGDEFLIVLPETDVMGGSKMALRVKTLLSHKRVDLRGRMVRITASFGISGFDRIEQKKKISPDRLINAADECLYQSKREGRNTVRVQKL